MKNGSKAAPMRQRPPVVTSVVKAATKPQGKPSKPYDAFPLTAHPCGHWAKKIRKKLHYFGPWGKRVDGVLIRLPDDGWKAALELYKQQADDLHAGRTPRAQSGGLTVGELGNRPHNSKKRQLDAGKTTPQTLAEYEATTDRVVAAFGKGRFVDDLAADDFEAQRAMVTTKWGPHRLSGEVQRVRTLFKYAYESGLIDRPVRYGPQFKKPSKQVMRKHRAAGGSKMLDFAEPKSRLTAAPAQLLARLLLGLNCGFGTLPLAAVDLDGGWLNFPFSKASIARRYALWPETVAAMRVAIAAAHRPMMRVWCLLRSMAKRGPRTILRRTHCPRTSPPSRAAPLPRVPT